MTNNKEKPFISNKDRAQNHKTFNFENEKKKKILIYLDFPQD